jgi:hypothetical protein
MSSEARKFKQNEMFSAGKWLDRDGIKICISWQGKVGFMSNLLTRILGRLLL